jgi:hypothetical protein
MTVPGVGAVTAAAYVATIGSPERFSKAKESGAYLGLPPVDTNPVKLIGRGGSQNVVTQCCGAYYSKLSMPYSREHGTNQHYERGDCH